MARPRTSSLAQRARAFYELWAKCFAEHDLLTYASAIAFRVLVALIPLTLLGLGLLGTFGLENVWTSQLAPQIQSRVTAPVFEAIDFTVRKIFSDASVGLLVLALLLSLWDVSSSVRACMGGINRIYEDEERRSTLRRFGISLGLGAAIAVAVLGSVVILTTAARLIDHGAGHWLLLVLRWPVAVATLAVAVGLLVRYAPVEPRKARWVSGGSIVIIAVWIVASFGFRWYVTSLANFKTAIGSLAVFLVLTTYVYVSAFIFLVGVQVDELARRGASNGEGGIVDALRGALGAD